MDLHDLLRPDGPWLRVFVGDAAAAVDAARALARGCAEGVPGVAVRHLRGRKMRRAAGVFDEFAAALQFPPYFGENWDALDECLTDLEWLPADAYVLLLLDAAHLLDQDRPEARHAFWETLKRAAREWGSPVAGGVTRPVRPFRVMLQGTAEEEGRVRAQLPPEAAPAGG
jgi:RNAse (barnase) inhibitor barstar